MFIGIVGSLGSGAEDVAEFLISQHNFTLLDKGTPTELVAEATSRWRENFVMRVDLSSADLELFLKRPFFLLISVDASISYKYRRYQRTHDVTLEQFVDLCERAETQDDCAFRRNSERAQLKLVNNSTTKESLYSQLESLNLLDPQRLRPNWDLYFMSLADLAAHRANCMKRRVGCVVVRENRVIATGYNGTPRNFKNCNEGGCPRCNSGDACGVGLSTCLCLHAEENALLEAGRDRIGSSATVYCNTCPCLTCSIKIVQAGISEVVYSQSYSMDSLSSNVFKQSGVNLRQFTPAKSGVVILK